MGLGIANGFVLNNFVRNSAPFPNGHVTEEKGVFRRQSVIKSLLAAVADTPMRRKLFVEKYGIMFYLGTPKPHPPTEVQFNGLRQRPESIAYPSVLEGHQSLADTQRHLREHLNGLRSCEDMVMPDNGGTKTVRLEVHEYDLETEDFGYFLL